MAGPIGTLPRRQLARQLKLLREQAGLTLEAAAGRLECSTSKLSRIETAQQLVDVHWVRGMLDLYNAGSCWEEMLTLARQAKERGWWRAFGLDDRGYVPLEVAAHVVREFNVTIIPGLLQTAEYARALFRSALVPVSEDQRARNAEVRMIRQRRLYAEQDPLHLEAIVDESVLRRPIGGPAVLHAQLDHLLIAAELDTVSWRVLPTEVGEHPGLDGGFALLSFGELGEPDLAYVEHVAGGVHIEKAEEVTRCSLAFDGLRSAALSPAESVALVERLAAQP
jgi:transcriptional regulator with XRE-family HTH domain